MGDDFRLGLISMKMSDTVRRSLYPLATAAAIVLALAGPAAGGTARRTVAPTNTAPPTIAGTATVGQVLTASTGTWSGTSPIAFAYTWKQCDAVGGACKNVANGSSSTFTLVSTNAGNTMRVEVAASNGDGASTSTSVPTGVVAAAATTTTTTTTTTTPNPPPTGCPSGTGPVNVSQLSLPTRLLITAVSATPSVIGKSIQSFSLKVLVTDTCNQVVGGALVYVTAVPYNMFAIPAEATTGADGNATLTMNRLPGFPVSSKQTNLVLFIRARKDGENLLAGISVRRLVSLQVNQKG
jgi:hypothetical protein